MKATTYHPAIHLDETQIQSTLEACPVCGSRIARRAVGPIQLNPSIELLRCEECLACSASHMPKAEVLEDYYGRYFSGGGAKTTLPKHDHLVATLSPVFPIFETTVRILDFGGGDGTLGLAIAHELLKNRFAPAVDFTLVDYQTPAATEATGKLNVHHRFKLEQVEGSFDLVLASAILEHIPELQTALRRLFSLLKPGGWFYARTAYAAPLKRLLPNLDITYPGHVHDLGAPFWNRAPATFRVPMRVVISRPSPVETQMTRQPVRTMLAGLMKFPARAELALMPARTPLWRLVGGWEVVLQRTA